jgi:transcriptional regulator with GAF, ATPase, and Fis domain
VPRELFESEFFGHVKGAYTGAHRDRSGRFELADGGTLFLDEVGEIPLELQGKLLGVLQERCFERVGEGRSRRVDVRIVAATNRDLPREVAAGRFRRDLYYRLNVVPILVPALRDRRADIPLLARHLLERIGGEQAGTMASLTADDLARLHDHDWPGNVRELHNVIERALILGCTGQALQLALDSPSEQVGETRPYPARSHVVLTESQRRVRDRDNILIALALAGGRIAGPGGAAELLELKPTTLRSRMKALGVAASEAGKIPVAGNQGVSGLHELAGASPGTA